MAIRGASNFDSVKVEWINHATVRLVDSDGFNLVIDPWDDVMDEKDYSEKADIIISTHDHFDHFDKKAIQQLKKRGTVLLCTKDSASDVPEDISHKIIEPGRTVKVKNHRIKGVHAYNSIKSAEDGEPFHPKGFCTGVIFEMDGVRFYHASDTDPIEEMEKLSGQGIDVAFVPIGGTYTMNQEEAIEAVKMINPEKVVPIHYGYIDETTADPEKFREEVESKTDSEPVILEQ